MSKGNVLYIGGFELPDKNAAAQRVLSNAKALRELGFEVEFIDTTKENKIRCNHLDIDGFKYSSVKYPKTIIEWFYYITNFVSTERINEIKPNYIILYNFPALASNKILRYGKKRNIKVVEDITEWYQEKGLKPINILKKIDIFLRMNYSLKRMDGLITISKFLYEYYKEYSKTILVPPLVDLEDIKWNRHRKVDTGDFLQLIYAGNPGTGFKDKIDVIIDSISQFPNMTLRIIGITKEEYFTSFKTENIIPENIHFLGRISHQESVKLIIESDFHIFFREVNRVTTAGFPTKFPESMSCCTPVIANLTSNIGDYLFDGENGFIVSGNQSLDDILLHISKMKKNDIVKMKNNCREVVVFDYRQHLGSFSEIFE